MQVVCQVFTKWLSSPPDPLFENKATIHLVAFFLAKNSHLCYYCNNLLEYSMSILRELTCTSHAGINDHRHSIIFSKFSILLKTICKIDISENSILDGSFFSYLRIGFNALEYKFKFGSISLNFVEATVIFNFEDNLIDVDHSIPSGMLSLHVNVDNDLNFKNAQYVKKFTVHKKEEDCSDCDIYLIYYVSKQLKFYTSVQYGFNYSLYTCFNLRNLFSPAIFLKDKNKFSETLMEMLSQYSKNSNEFHQVFDYYPSVTSQEKACDKFLKLYIKEYKSKLDVLRDNLLTLQMASF